MRIKTGQEFVIGGYTPSQRTFDALLIGYYEADKLIFVAETRNGFVPTVKMHVRLRICLKRKKAGGVKD